MKCKLENAMERINKPLTECDDQLSEQDSTILRDVVVPVSKNEGRRVKVLRECNVLDSNSLDEDYDRQTALLARILKVYFLKFTLHSSQINI